eukprot:Lankesteria_metandrocarpae@DN340_c0_g1_i1.p1
MVDYEAILVPKEDLVSTPSERDGVDRATENILRSYGCSLVQQAGVYLRLKGVTVASADIMLHRFYFRRSLREFDIRFVAAASLYLACKLQEDGRRVSDIIHVFTFIHWRENRSTSPDTEPPSILASDSDEFKQIRNIIHRVERYILRETGFMASQSLCLPHPHILKFVDQLFCKLDGIDPNAVAQTAWGYINDSYRSTLCCEVEPRVVAAASIYMAASDLEVPLSKDTRWYELLGVTWESMTEATERIHQIYKDPEPYYIKLVKPGREDEAAVVNKDNTSAHPTERNQNSNGKRGHDSSASSNGAATSLRKKDTLKQQRQPLPPPAKKSCTTPNSESSADFTATTAASTKPLQAAGTDTCNGSEANLKRRSSMAQEEDEQKVGTAKRTTVMLPRATNGVEVSTVLTLESLCADALDEEQEIVNKRLFQHRRDGEPLF